jgi:hypothetical protein
MQNPVPERYTGSRLKAGFFLLLSLAFVSIPFLIGAEPKHWQLWAGSLFFAVCAVAFVVALARPQVLLLDPEGFALGGGFAGPGRKVRWDDVEAFFPLKLPRGGRIVGYTYREGRAPATMQARVNRSLGADGALPAGWSVPPQVMAERLNDYRRRATGSSLG